MSEIVPATDGEIAERERYLDEIERANGTCPPSSLPLMWSINCERSLIARIAALKAIVDKLADDKFACEIADDCHDSGHDSRWCPTCSARRAGIEAYREAIQAAEAAKDGA